jgi:AcrR family transcriptional regulator
MTTLTAPATTRDAIIRSAERLFASRGIDGVSLREINRDAGARNASALQYHFGDRAGLLRAVLEKHRADTEPRRHALLDRYAVDGAPDTRSLVAALVLPLAGKLSDPDGGRHYLQINAEVSTRPAFTALIRSPDPANSMRRWHAVLDRVRPETGRAVLHSRFPAIRFAFVELARRASERPRRDDRLFVSHLVDLVTAVLEAPVSPATEGLLRGAPPSGSPGSTAPPGTQRRSAR